MIRLRMAIRCAALLCAVMASALVVAAEPPLGTVGTIARYELVSAPKASNIVELTAAIGAVEDVDNVSHQWFRLHAVKQSGEHLRVWVLADAMPPQPHNVARYIVQQGGAPPREFRHPITMRPVLPATGAWPYLFPRAGESNANAAEPFPERVEYLGLQYQRVERSDGGATDAPPTAEIVSLRPDMLMGTPINTREADETRRYDDSEYDYIPLTDSDFETMIAAGINCFTGAPQLSPVIEAADVFYWGVDASTVPYPETLYDPRYLGPALFIDEPAVVTRDHALRPKLAEDPAFRRALTPQAAFAEFETHFEHVIANAAPTYLMQQLAGRADADVGTMQFPQANLYTWETMISGAAYELGHDPAAPGAIVFEPPGHVGARRLLPSMNIAYGCEIPVTGTDHFIDIVIGFLRGAARATDKEWGISIYGSVEQADALPFLRRAYDLGATRFFYWNAARLACVPHGEVLNLSRQLTDYAHRYPDRDLDGLLRAADLAILLPPGYNLGHVHMARGLLWGVPELNLERRNRYGIPYRTVMGNFFTEIERSLRHGEPFDLLWDLPGLRLDGYREVVRIREDGRVDVIEEGTATQLDAARVPDRPNGAPPRIAVTVSRSRGRAPLTVRAVAHVVEGSAPVYFSPKPDDSGVHHNHRVAWELYGPHEEDYDYRGPAIRSGAVTLHPDGGHVVEAAIRLKERGTYRLRAATTDLAGKSAVVWQTITVK